MLRFIKIPYLGKYPLKNKIMRNFYNNLGRLPLFMKRRTLVKHAKRFWHFIWHDDSIWSWIANIVIAFVLIKFIIYPVLGLAFGTTHPIVAVVSGSMEHKLVHPCAERQGSLCTEYDRSAYEICGRSYDKKERVDLDLFWIFCGDWYAKKNITKEHFQEFPYKNGFNTGDIMVLWGKKPQNIHVGDVIVFQGQIRNDPIIHRVVDKWESDGRFYFQTKGDHNPDSNFDEFEIAEERIIGYEKYEKGSVAVLQIPYLGYLKIIFVQILTTILSFWR